MSDDRDNTFDDLAAAAESAVAELEALKPRAWIPDDARRGTPATWTSEQREAEEATKALRTVATETLFPDAVVPIGADLKADFEHHAAPSGYRGAALAELHGRALKTHPSLAKFIRTARVVDLVRRNARGPSTDRDPAAEAVAELVAGVAEQLTGNAEFEPAASLLAERIPDLQARVVAAVKRCETEAVAQAHTELSGWFREHIPNPVQIGRERLGSEEIAERIEQGDESFIDLARHYHLHHPAGGGQTTRGRAIYG